MEEEEKRSSTILKPVFLSFSGLYCNTRNIYNDSTRNSWRDF